MFNENRFAAGSARPSPPARRRFARPAAPVAIAAVLLSGLLAASCTYSQKNVIKPGALSPTLGPMLYKEEGALVLMTVGVTATRFHADDPFIPLEVWVANKGVERPLRLSRESFYLVDTFGKRYGMAGVEEVLRLQKGMTLDRQINSASFNGAKFDGFRLVQTAFFPIPGLVIVNDHAELARYSFMMDMLYFPRPDGELNGSIFELHLQDPALPQDIFVVFEVPAG